MADAAAHGGLVRILYWSELFWPYAGGAEIFARSLLPALRDRGAEISVVTSHDHLDLPDRADLDGVPVYRFPMRAALARRRLDEVAEVTGRVREVKRALCPDVVHVSGLGPATVFHLLTEPAHPAPFLLSLRTEVLPSQRPAGHSLLGRALAGAGWVTAVSAAVLDQVRRLAPGIAGRSSVLPNFVEPPARRPGPLPFAPPRLLCLGRLIEAKGFDLAVRALAAVRVRHPGARLVIAGDGPERPSLERLVGRLGLGDAVEFPGAVARAELPGLLDAATLLLVPSRREGLSMVALEAALMARPVVAARTGGLPEVVVDGQTGRLVPPGDVPALAEAINALLDEPSGAAELGRRARLRATAAFGRDRWVDAYVGLYHTLSRAGRGSVPADRRAEIGEEDRGPAPATAS